MCVARVDAKSVVNLDHISVSAARTRPDHSAWRRRGHDGPIGTSKVDAGMEGVATRKRVDASTKSACVLDIRTVYRNGKRNVAERREETVHLLEDCRSAHVGSLERRVANSFDVNRLNWQVRPPDPKLARVLLGINSGATNNSLKTGDP